MPALHRITLIAAAFFIPLVLAMPVSHGATAVQLDLPALVHHSDVIVIAQVQDTSTSLESDGRVYTTVELRTDEPLLGHPAKQFKLRQVGGVDPDTGIGTHAPGLPHLTPGERVFLFLEERSANLVLTGLAQGKFTIAQGPDGATDYVIPRTPGLRTIPRRDDDASPPLKEQSLQLTTHERLYSQTHRLDHFRDEVMQVIDALADHDAIDPEEVP